MVSMDNGGMSTSPSSAGKMQQVPYTVNDHQLRSGSQYNFYPYPVPHGTAVTQSPAVVLQGYTPGMSPIFSPTFWNSPSASNSGIWTSRIHPQPYEPLEYRAGPAPHRGMQLNELLIGKQKQVQRSRSTLLGLHKLEEREENPRIEERKWSLHPQPKDEGYHSNDSHRMEDRLSRKGSDPHIGNSFESKSKQRMAIHHSPDKKLNSHRAIQVESPSSDIQFMQGYSKSQRSENSTFEEPGASMNLQPFPKTMFQPQPTHFLYVPIAVQAQGSPSIPMYPYPPGENHHSIHEHQLRPDPAPIVLEHNQLSNLWLPKDTRFSYSAPNESNIGQHSRISNVLKSPNRDGDTLVHAPAKGQSRCVDSSAKDAHGSSQFTKSQDAGQASLASDYSHLNINDQSKEASSHSRFYSDDYNLSKDSKYYNDFRSPMTQSQDEREIKSRNIQTTEESRDQSLNEPHPIKMAHLKDNVNTTGASYQPPQSAQKFWVPSLSSHVRYHSDPQQVGHIQGGTPIRSNLFMSNKIQGMEYPGVDWSDSKLPQSLGNPFPVSYPNLHDAKLPKRPAGEMPGQMIMRSSSSRMYPLQLTAAPKKARQKLDELQTALHQLQQVNQRLTAANDSLRFLLDKMSQSRPGASKRSLAKLAERNACLRHAILELQSLSSAGKSVSDDQLAVVISRCHDLLEHQDDPPVQKKGKVIGNEYYGDIRSDSKRFSEASSWSLRDAANASSYDQRELAARYSMISSSHDSAATLLSLANPRTHMLPSVHNGPLNSPRLSGAQIHGSAYSSLGSNSFRSFAEPSNT